MSAPALPRRVVVTGATGKLGRAVVAHLRAVGVDVLAVDRAAGRDPRDIEGEFLQVDLTDYGQVVEAFTGGADEHAGGVDAIVHLAAVPAPGLLPNAITFANNSAAT
ncbi:hypothetical protein GCM10027614_01540 [Micromonospora vulcania]